MVKVSAINYYTKDPDIFKTGLQSERLIKKQI